MEFNETMLAGIHRRAKSELTAVFEGHPFIAPSFIGKRKTLFSGKTNVMEFADLTALKAETSPDDIRRLCETALNLRCKSVCTKPKYLFISEPLLLETETLPICVAGFPKAPDDVYALITEMKLSEICGAREIDIVAPADLIQEERHLALHNYFKKAVSSVGVPVKIIIETCLHTKENIAKTSIIAAIAGAMFVKTSTGFGDSGATVEDVMLMRMCVGDSLGVKASGGIRTVKAAEQMLAAGADRIGTSGILS